MFNYQEGEDKIYIPNEIFVDFVGCEEIKSGSHVAFAYSYYWLISWLYRYTKYYNNESIKVTTKDIKRALGYNENDKKVDYLIKKNGVLDQLGYSRLDSDVPLNWIYRDNELTFELLSEFDEDNRKYIKKQLGRTFTYKLPVKGIWRTPEDEEDNYWNGTFYEIDNTHLVNYSVFDICMSNKELGCKGFYLYGYLKCRCQWYNGKFNKSMDQIAAEVRLNRKTVMRLIHDLKNIGLVSYESSDVIYKDGELTQYANTYQVNI